MFEVGYTPHNCNMAVIILFDDNKSKAAKALGLKLRQLQRYCSESNYQTMPHEKWLDIIALLKKHKARLDADLKQTQTKKAKKSDIELPQLF